jgi:hypothetical protein
VLDPAFPQEIIEPRIDPDVLPDPLHVTNDEPTDGLDRMPSSATTGRLVLARPQRYDVLSLDLFGPSSSFSFCHGSSHPSEMQMTSSPGALLRVTGHGTVGPLDDPGRHPTIAPNGSEEAHFPGQALASVRHERYRVLAAGFTDG